MNVGDPMRALGLLLLFGCPSGDDAKDDSKGDSTPDSTARTCDDIVTEFTAETQSIRSCTAPDECGQELTGTSCGCTRNWVARTDADTTTFYTLLHEAAAAGCELGLTSTCDCPDTGGFDCVDETCTWAYTR